MAQEWWEGHDEVEQGAKTEKHQAAKHLGSYYPRKGTRQSRCWSLWKTTVCRTATGRYIKEEFDSLKEELKHAYELCHKLPETRRVTISLLPSRIGSVLKPRWKRWRGGAETFSTSLQRMHTLLRNTENLLSPSTDHSMAWTSHAAPPSDWVIRSSRTSIKLSARAPKSCDKENLKRSSRAPPFITKQPTSHREHPQKTSSQPQLTNQSTSVWFPSAGGKPPRRTLNVMQVKKTKLHTFLMIAQSKLNSKMNPKALLLWLFQI